MREKEDMRDMRVCTRNNEESKKYLRKWKNLKHVSDVGAIFIDLLKKYEYVAK